MNPQVTILLPTYKSAPLLERAIRSVASQTVKEWELLVIDDGLHPEPQQQLRALAAIDQRVKILQNEQNYGIQRSLNRGIAEARGTYIARIDDDDIWTDNQKLQKQIAYFVQHPQAVLVGTNAMIADDARVLGEYHMPESDASIRSRMLSKNCFLHPTIMMRTETVRAVGGYPEGNDTKHIEDYALWLQLGTKGLFANLPDQSTTLTVHTDSLTAQHRLVQAIRMRALIKKYKQVYPRYSVGYFLLTLRQIGFWFISRVPIPKQVLYFIQKLYKSF